MNFNELAGQIASQLSEIKSGQVGQADQASWDMARTYVQSYDALSDAYKEIHGKQPKTHQINKAIRSANGYIGPGSSWLSNARRLNDFLPNLLLSNSKTLNYDAYMAITTNSLPADKKQALLKWAETEQPTQRVLRAEIRDRADREKGISRPDFQLKVGNCWSFSSKTQPDGFDGGISPELVANLLHYFTDPGNIIIDPMAGSDVVFKVLKHYKYFQEHSELKGMEHSGPRSVLRADIAPTNPDITQHDILDDSMSMPWGSSMADFCLLDPPYYEIANGKYGNFGDTIEEWLENMEEAISTVVNTLRQDGILAVVTDDYMRADEFQPLASKVLALCEELTPIATIYNTYANFIMTMSPMEMSRAKKARLMVNQTKIIHVFEV